MNIWVGIWLGVLLTLTIILLIIVSVFHGHDGSRGRRGRRGSSGTAGNAGVTGAAGATGGGVVSSSLLNTGQSFVGFVSLDTEVQADNFANIVSIMTYGANQNIPFNQDSINEEANQWAVVATNTGLFYNLVATLHMNQTNQTGATGFVTLWKTNGCETAFHPTELSAAFDVPPTGVDQLVCMSDTTHQVTVAPNDRFVMIWSIEPHTGASFFQGPATSSFLYSF